MKEGYEWKLADPILYPLLKENANRLRNNTTESERCLWQYLKGHVKGFRFRRQFIIGSYIADFACVKARLVIEIDVAYHNTEAQQLRDAARTEVINKFGYQVLRFTNEEVIANTQQVYDTILQFFQE